MSEHILFLTGSLAEAGLRQTLEKIAPEDFTWEVHQLGLKVAALMTADMIRRRLPDTGSADRVLVPGRCRGDLDTLSNHYGVPFQRGPEELRDLPEWLGHGANPPDLTQYDVLIFAEIVDAPQISIEAICERALSHQADGADVIDLGCLPEIPFPHLQETVQALKALGLKVSVDSMNPQDLLDGGKAGADYLLSLSEDSLWIADEVESTPILIPGPGYDLDSLCRAWQALHDKGHSCYVDPILDPIHFGFTTSVVRYHETRKRLPDAQMMMGVGNLTELTEADTNGINALLMGIISELHIGAILTTQVSQHCRSAIREADLARRIMYRARADKTLPKRLHRGLCGLHERKPFPYDSDEIRKAATRVKDRNYRIQINDDGVHLYNRDTFVTAVDPFDHYPHLQLDDDTGHAFYLGVELARAQIAQQLGKRYTQDQELDWGAALPIAEDDKSEYSAPASTKCPVKKP